MALQATLPRTLTSEARGVITSACPLSALVISETCGVILLTILCD